MLREVTLPDSITGHLYLYNMPGRLGFEHPFEEDSAMISAQSIDRVVCLATFGEIKVKSPDYARAIESGKLAWRQDSFPIADFSTPSGEKYPAFLALIRQVAQDLRKGKKRMIHCAAGIGRTGTMAICVLIALGVKKDEAYQAVSRVGSQPETSEQRLLVDRVEKDRPSYDGAGQYR